MQKNGFKKDLPALRNRLLVNIGEFSLMFTEPEANHCFSIIFSGENQELQNSGLSKNKYTGVIVRVHARM